MLRVRCIRSETLPEDIALQCRDVRCAFKGLGDFFPGMPHTAARAVDFLSLLDISQFGCTAILVWPGRSVMVRATVSSCSCRPLCRSAQSAHACWHQISPQHEEGLGTFKGRQQNYL